MTLLDDALFHAGMSGWAVFPLAPGDKVPKIPSAHPAGDPLRGKCRGACGRDGHGLYDATTDYERIQTWWRRWPNANIGIRTGEISDLLVIDVDTDAGGAASIEGLQKDYEELPATLTATTPRGWHLYFRWPGGDITINANKIGPGIDHRGNGGYVAAPPSRRREGVYAWAHPIYDVARAPGWLVALVTKPKLRPAGAVVSSRPDAYGGTALERAVYEVANAPEGGGNGVLNGCAYALGRLVGGGLLDDHQVADALVAAAVARGRESESRARAIVISGMAAGKANPRHVVAFEAVR